MNSSPVDYSDIARICGLLEQLIKTHETNEKEMVDKSIGKPITDTSTWGILYTQAQITEIELLHKRLEAMLPRRFFFDDEG
jgi:hypothetical protein